jgi:hypothetical protein
MRASSPPPTAGADDNIQKRSRPFRRVRNVVISEVVSFKSILLLILSLYFLTFVPLTFCPFCFWDKKKFYRRKKVKSRESHCVKISAEFHLLLLSLNIPLCSIEQRGWTVVGREILQRSLTASANLISKPPKRMNLKWVNTQIFDTSRMVSVSLYSISIPVSFSLLNVSKILTFKYRTILPIINTLPRSIRFNVNVSKTNIIL